MAYASAILVLGLGNSLLSDDGVGVHVIHALSEGLASELGLTCLDGGTLGLSLLPDVEAAGGLILVDASEFGGRPGDIRLFEGAAMDLHLGGKKHNAHEVAAFDLLSAAALTGHLPRRRVLLAIQPLSIAWGLAPTPPVAAAISKACATVATLAREWQAEVLAADALTCEAGS